MLYLRIDFSQNNLLDEFKQRGSLNFTKREKLNLINGPHDYYERTTSELEKFAKTKGYNSLEEAKEKNKEFLELQNFIENKFISYFAGEIYLTGIIGGLGFVNLFY